MKRLKTLFLYGLMIAAFWFLSDFLIYMAIHGTYKPIDTRIVFNTPTISISESKATYVNGYVKGNIYNDTDKTIDNKYLKIDLYSQRDVLMGTKYVKIENLEKQKKVDFEMWFKFTDVKYCIINMTDDISNATEEQLLSQETQFYLVIGTLFILYFI